MTAPKKTCTVCLEIFKTDSLLVCRKKMHFSYFPSRRRKNSFPVDSLSGRTLPASVYACVRESTKVAVIENEKAIVFFPSMVTPRRQRCKRTIKELTVFPSFFPPVGTAKERKKSANAIFLSLSVFCCCTKCLCGLFFPRFYFPFKERLCIIWFGWLILFASKSGWTVMEERRNLNLVLSWTREQGDKTLWRCT